MVLLYMEAASNMTKLLTLDEPINLVNPLDTNIPILVIKIMMDCKDN